MGLDQTETNKQSKTDVVVTDIYFFSAISGNDLSGIL